MQKHMSEHVHICGCLCACVGVLMIHFFAAYFKFKKQCVVLCICVHICLGFPVFVCVLIIFCFLCMRSMGALITFTSTWERQTKRHTHTEKHTYTERETFCSVFSGACIIIESPLSHQSPHTVQTNLCLRKEHETLHVCVVYTCTCNRKSETSH